MFLFPISILAIVICLCSYRNIENKKELNEYNIKLKNGTYLKEWEQRHGINYPEYVKNGGGTHPAESHNHPAESHNHPAESHNHPAKEK